MRLLLSTGGLIFLILGIIYVSFDTIQGILGVY